MNLKIELVDGDYGRQTAEYILIGLLQQPGIGLEVERPVKNWRGKMRPRPIYETWPIAEKVAKVEILEEATAPPGKEWGLPELKPAHAEGNVFASFPSAPPLKRVKRIRFKIYFKDGTSATAIADARVAQNIHALVS